MLALGTSPLGIPCQLYACRVSLPRELESVSILLTNHPPISVFSFVKWGYVIYRWGGEDLAIKAKTLHKLACLAV